MKSRYLRSATLPLLAALAVAASCGPCVRLPIYRLAPATVTRASVNDLALQLGSTVPSVVETSDRFIARSGPLRIEVYKASGGYWVEDSTSLWVPDLHPLVSDTSTFFTAGGPAIGPAMDRLHAASGADSDFVHFDFAGFGRSMVATYDALTHARTVETLDVQLNYGAKVRDPTRRSTLPPLPVVGGGGAFKMVFGDHDKLVGLNGVWRRIQRIERYVTLRPRSRADAEFQRSTRNLQIVSFKATLAYYSAPASFQQTLLVPVYVYRAIASVHGKPVHLKETYVDASEVSLRSVLPASTASPRTNYDQPRLGSADPEGPEEGGTGASVSSWRELATYTLGETDGLPESEENVLGFVEPLVGDGWTVNQQWRDGDAWYEDWKNDRQRWVDTADLVYYCGHAGSEGWQLEDHDHVSPQNPRVPTDLAPEDVAAASSSGGGMYGGNDLEWIVISACGPLEDDGMNPEGGVALDRWSGAFGGLHLLLGYGATVADNHEEGALFAQRLLEGKTLIHAWFRTATETQDSTNDEDPPFGPDVYVAAMWAYDSAHGSPFNDHLWGHGSVAQDSRHPTKYRLMWTQT